MRTHSSLPHSAQHSASYTTAQLATMPTGHRACHSSETDTDLCVGSEHCVMSSVCYFKCALWKCIHMRNPICLRSCDMHSREFNSGMIYLDESDLLKVMWERFLTTFSLQVKFTKLKYETQCQKTLSFEDRFFWNESAQHNIVLFTRAGPPVQLAPHHGW